jgi:hypothetical protein
MGITSMKKLFKKMESWGVETAIQGINESISNNWQGIFPPKKGIHSYNGRNRDTGTANEHIQKTGYNDLF